ncbi:MAG TPA: hypothetical protein PK166_15780 [Candidatus Hydrogenedentes bacterium]|nr:hypothetical protein [Candidatus Hydrogenedentota bacterium]
MSAALCSLCLILNAAGQPGFAAARPVWPEGRETEMNLFVGFRAVFEHPGDGPVTVRLTGASNYRVFVNGQFLCHGPARAAHGFFRIDEYDAAALLRPGTNVVAIEAAGYNVNSYYIIDQPAFLQAEIVNGDAVIAATGTGSPFEAAILEQRIQKVERFSYQRPFIEAYRLAPASYAWRTDPGAALTPCSLGVTAEKALIARHIPCPAFKVRPALRVTVQGELVPGQEPEKLWPGHAGRIDPEYKGYPTGVLEVHPSQEIQKLATVNAETVDTPLDSGSPVELPENTFRILDLGTNLSGFLGATITCSSPVTVYLAFDEILTRNDVHWARMGCAQFVPYYLAPGTYQVESFEPYTMRYVKVMAVGGACTIEHAYLREYVYPDAYEATFASSDPRLATLFEAGRETFVQNGTDVFMDCPSRERAGWLCDSFFTARTALVLSGDTRLERNFYENFLLPERFAHLPEGMLPMCYPSDHYNGNFIPNWAMWFVVELEEYAARSNDRAMVDALKPKVLALFDYFRKFENDDGLLEKLERWVFVEWSAANDFVQDVNYPTNMLYAGTLAAAGRLYGMPDLLDKAERIREVIREQSFDGEFFVDNAVYEEGQRKVTRNRTEVCQYFAFFFDVATPETHGALWEKLHREFGPDRSETKAYPEVHPANSFIGNMLRFELLSRHGLGMQITDESVGYLMYMAERTGTLWENVHDQASCNHGFASHICFTLYRDVLGVYRFNPIQKTITLRFNDVGLDWCEGAFPVLDGMIRLRWDKSGNTLRYRLEIPDGYAVTIENPAGMVLEPVEN